MVTFTAYCENMEFEKYHLFKAWWSPFKLEVWIHVGLSIFITSLVLSFSYALRNHLVQNKRFSMSANDCFNFFFLSLRGVLRQVCSSKEFLLILSSTIAIIYTSLYENTITIELIAPDAPIVDSSYKSLIQRGYYIIISVEDQAIVDYQNSSHVFTAHSSALNYVLNKRRALFVTEMTYGDMKRNLYEKLCAVFLSYNQKYRELVYLQVNRIVPKLDCFVAQETTDFQFSLFMAYTSFNDEVSKVTNNLKKFGLVQFWNDLSMHNILVFGKRKQPGEIDKTLVEEIRFISLKNLTPVFALWGMKICLVTVLFEIFETRLIHLTTLARYRFILFT